MAPIKRVAVIGLGPAGAIAIDALAQEKAFDVIRVFERREKAGGCWCVHKTFSLSWSHSINSQTSKAPKMTISSTNQSTIDS